MLYKRIAWCFLLLWGTSCSSVCKAQNFSELFDLANNSDAASNICTKANGSYFITGQSYSQLYRYGSFSMVVSASGKTVEASHLLQSVNTNYFSGEVGNVLPYGPNFVSPLTLVRNNGAAGVVIPAGIMIYDSLGAIVLSKTFTDTTRYVEGTHAMAVLPDSSFLICGERDSVPYQISWGIIRHISSTGELLWTRTYMPTAKIDTTLQNRFTSIEALPNHNILVGGMARKGVILQGSGFHFNHPWMLLLDSVGNILKDTMYSDHYYPGCYVGGGKIHSDVNGGYYHWGGKDSTPTPYPQSPDYLGNYPFYLAHLDSTFKMEWRVSFPTTNKLNTVPGAGYGNLWNVIQTKDSGYLVMGDRGGGYIVGWLEKIDKHGKITWEHSYYIDSNSNGYLVDAEERSGGGFVAVGWTNRCKSCSQDVWLLSVDSNGCELPGCGNGLAVSPVPLIETSFDLYPNPTTGAFTVSCSETGQLLVYNLQGMKVANYAIQVGKQSLQFQQALSPGVYIGQYQSTDGKTSRTTRIIYQP